MVTLSIRHKALCVSRRADRERGLSHARPTGEKEDQEVLTHLPLTMWGNLVEDAMTALEKLLAVDHILFLIKMSV
ncbi:12361_t:CDS:2 [Acaulospora colombiana]|uniref:12361_t:CDS:1 n=1 Tax=Acaulospora colombiana TaxID=27376 RepID=A0ACA9N230_9GLOM|nr:12361_t:CDS:2 [Acaulospora colombiana]